ncbi:ribonuclease P protein component [Clostridium rectalis]|uniref:ribonuclease P protein component n=1 Tax=Clostridium rectalis TaxID=2040295 RepID=UPI000F632B7D|nr:ribonuclease P protein component [Clostridium rectalis]
MNKHKLRKNMEFRLVYRRGKSFSNSLLVLYVYKNSKIQDNRLGISVSKKVGKSVVRNRVKRLIKESYRLNYNKLKQGYDLIFIARVNANDKDFKNIENAMLNLCKKAGLYNS